MGFSNSHELLLPRSEARIKFLISELYSINSGFVKQIRCSCRRPVGALRSLAGALSSCPLPDLIWGSMRPSRRVILLLPELPARCRAGCRRTKCPRWAESAPTTIASGRTRVRAKASFFESAGRLHRSKARWPARRGARFHPALWVFWRDDRMKLGTQWLFAKNSERPSAAVYQLGRAPFARPSEVIMMQSHESIGPSPLSTPKRKCRVRIILHDRLCRHRRSRSAFLSQDARFPNAE